MSTYKEGDLLKIGEVASILGVSTPMVRTWTDKGSLQSVITEGGHRFFKFSDVIKMKESIYAEEKMDYVEEAKRIRQVRLDRVKQLEAELKKFNGYVVGLHLTFNTRHFIDSNHVMSQEWFVLIAANNHIIFAARHMKDGVYEFITFDKDESIQESIVNKTKCLMIPSPHNIKRGGFHDVFINLIDHLADL